MSMNVIVTMIIILITVITFFVFDEKDNKKENYKSIKRCDPACDRNADLFCDESIMKCVKQGCYTNDDCHSNKCANNRCADS